jgi:hypothetical protein
MTWAPPDWSDRLLPNDPAGCCVVVARVRVLVLLVRLVRVLLDLVRVLVGLVLVVASRLGHEFRRQELHPALRAVPGLLARHAGCIGQV